MGNYSNLSLEKSVNLLEINKLLTQSLKLEEVLQNVIISASKLISVSDTFIIYLYDENTHKLRFAEGKGIYKDTLQQIAFSPGESIAGLVFKNKKPKLFKSEEEIDACMSNMSAVNYHHYYNGVYRRKIKSTICVPILNKDRCLGVIVVNNFKQDGIFTESDMQVIKAVADQSAIAIDNSNVYYSLKEKNDLLLQSTTIHKKFYKLIIEGGGIDKILSLLESIINTKVSYQLTSFYTKGDAVFPIVRRNEVLGLLELEKAFQSYTEMEQIAIEHASSTIALELIKDNALFEKELYFRREVFNQLLEGLSMDDLHRVLDYINWERKWNMQCIIVEGKQEPLWDQVKLIDKEWFVRSIEDISKSICGRSFVFTSAFQLIIVVPKIGEDFIDQIISSIELKWGARKGLIFGIGRETTIRELSTSYNEAISSIRYAKSNKDINVVEYAKLGIERVLHEVEPTTIEMFISDKLSGLLKMDYHFIETLRTLIKHNKNHKKTAKALHIHANTLYYRLKKIEEVLNISLNDEKEWLDLVIAIRLFVASNKE
ncbi:helix-turn-helix domain-containing protein [Virgibacillus sp. FSP13]